MNKRILSIFALMFVFSFVAVPARADLIGSIATGVSVLDTFLNGFAQRGTQSSQLDNVLNELQYGLEMSPANIRYLTDRGYNYGEIYYLGLIHRSTGLSYDRIIAARKPGMGWGQLAHQLGVPPSELNKRRVALKKHTKSESYSKNDDDRVRLKNKESKKEKKHHQNHGQSKKAHGKGKK